MARFSDLESGFEKFLALAYGRHIITGHPILHSIGLESGGGSGKEVVLQVALGDGAYNEAGEGAWGVCSSPGLPGCMAADLADIPWASLDGGLGGLIELPSGELEKQIPPGDLDTYVTALSPEFEGSNCFNVQWLQSELKHTQRLFFIVRAVDEPFEGANTNGWFFTTLFGDNPFVTQIIGGVLNTLVSYEFPMACRIWGDGSGSGNVRIAVGGYPPDLDDWSGALGVGFTYDDTKTYVVEVSIRGLDGDPIPTAAKPVAACGFALPLSICQELERVLYAGFDIPIETNVHYHPGTISTGELDPLQGVDPWFPGGLTYSATPNIVVLLPEGIDEDADASKLAVIVKTSSIADYDIDGNLISIGYSANPARVKADMLKRRGQHQRIYWPSFIHARDYYDGLLDWEAGDTTNTYSVFTGVPTFDTFGNITITGDSGSKPSPTNASDNHAITQQRILAGTTGHFKLKVTGAFPTFTGGGAMYLVNADGIARYGIAWGNGHYAILANGVAIDDITIPYDFPAVAGDTFELGVDGSGNFYLKQNGTLKLIPQGVAPAPIDEDFFGKVQLWASGAGFDEAEFSGRETVTTENNVTQVKRFEAHPAFTGPVDIGTALDYVDSLCASDTQDAGKFIIFLTPEPRAAQLTAIGLDAVPHVFDEDVNCREVHPKQTDIRERPNRLWAKFRNLDLQFLDQDSVFDLRDELFNRLGRTIDPGALNFASMSASQAQRLIKFEMRRRSDNYRWCELVGFQDSYKVLPADVVVVLSRKYNVEFDTGGFNSAATTVNLKTGETADFRLEEVAVPFFATVWNFTDYPHPLMDPNREIVQVTDVTGDVLTIVRGQQGTVASNHNTGGKRYLLGRIPKPFLVVSATRESGETTPLTRFFTLQEYYDNDYRDTDHGPQQPPIGTPPPSPFLCPPTPVLELDQESTTGIGSPVTKIIGTVHFGIYAYSQKVKVFVSFEGGPEVDTGLEVTPVTGTTTGTFEYFPGAPGSYTIRIQVFGGENQPCGSSSADISISDFILNPPDEEFILDPVAEEFIIEP